MVDIWSYFCDVAVQVAILFILIAVGIVIGKLKIVTKTGVDQIISILLYVVTPCLIVNSFLSVEFNEGSLRELGIAAGCAVITHIIGIALAFLFARVRPNAKRAVYRFGVILSNGGFMSLPMAQALVGEKGVFLVSMYVIVFNIMTWTYGISLFRSDNKSSYIKLLVNPGVIGVIIGLPLFFASVSLPPLITAPLGYISSLNTPLAMLVTGFFLMSFNIKDCIKDLNMWLAAALRLIAVPIICICLFKYIFGISGALLTCLAIPASAPSAVNTMMISAKFGGDAEKASHLLCVTTVLSVVTMPLLLVFAAI